MGATQTFAVEHLHASGAVPIRVTERDGVCTIHLGRFVEKSREIVSISGPPNRMPRWWRGEACRLANVSSDLSAASPPTLSNVHAALCGLLGN
jgi:hypothetical protein